MANLLSQNIGTNYKSILNLDATTINTPLDTTLRAVTDGMGTSSPLQLSTEQVGISRTVALSAGATNPRLFNEVYTINNSGAQTGTLTGLFLNATETALNGITHNLMDLQVGGVSKFKVDRVGNIYAAAGTQLTIGQIYFGNAYILNPSNGVLTMYNNAANGFDRLQLGGTTSSFPAIKRNGAAIDFRLADDSGYAQLNLGNIFGYSAANVIRYKLGEISGGCAISTRDGQFAVGLLDANQNAGLRLLGTGSGISYIDGYSEGVTKATNYPIVFGSRLNNTGLAITGSTTQENGTPCVFGSDSYNASALVQINSTTRGFLPPRMTTTQKNAITTPAAGLVVYDTTLAKLCVYTTAWETITSI